MARVAAGGALSDTFRIRAAARYTNYDGDVENTLTDAESNSAEIFAGRLSAELNVSENTVFKLVYQNDRENRNPTSDLLFQTDDFPISGQSGLAEATRDTDRITARIESDFNESTLVVIAGYENTDITNNFDLTDAVLAPVAFGIPAGFTLDPDNDRSKTATDEETINIEIRLQSNNDTSLQWLAGLNYLDLTFDRDLERRSIIPPFNVDEISTNSNVTYAAFADLSYNPTDDLSVGGGIRVARDEVDFESSTDFFGPLTGTPTFSEQASFDNDYIVGNVRAIWDLGNHSLFARYAHGFASGGFGEFAGNALIRQPINPFQSTSSDSFELGARGEFGILSYGISGFFNDVTDGQVYQFDGATFTNIAENLDFETYGIEIQARAAFVEWFTLDVGLGIQHSEFNNLLANTLSGARNGNSVPLAPDLTLSAALSGDKQIDGFGKLSSVFYTLSLQHIDDRAADPANSFILPEYTIVDARLGVTVGAFDIYIFGSNIGNEVALLYGQNFGSIENPIPTANINRGRVIGGGIYMRF